MIEINLLPLSQRKRKSKGTGKGKGKDKGKGKGKGKVELPPAIFIAVGGGLLLLLVLTAIGLAVGVGIKKGSLQKVKESLGQIKTESEKVAARKQEEEKLRKRMAIIEQLMDNRILWARKLDRLNSLIPPRVWLTSLYIEKKSEENKSDNKSKNKEKTEVKKVTSKFLVIKGITASAMGETGGLKLVGDFMDRLKNDSSFYEDFTSIRQQGSLRWRQGGGVEAMYFELRCQFKEGR